MSLGQAGGVAGSGSMPEKSWPRASRTRTVGACGWSVLV